MIRRDRSPIHWFGRREAAAVCDLASPRGKWLQYTGLFNVGSPTYDTYSLVHDQPLPGRDALLDPSPR